MVKRHAEAQVRALLRRFPVVALLGPRQVGKTSLALALRRAAGAAATLYLDLESPTDRAKLADAEAYLDASRGSGPASSSSSGRRRSTCCGSPPSRWRAASHSSS